PAALRTERRQPQGHRHARKISARTEADRTPARSGLTVYRGSRSLKKDMPGEPGMSRPNCWHQHGGGGASPSLGLIAFRPSPQVNLLKSIGLSVAFSLCAHRLKLQKSS